MELENKFTHVGELSLSHAEGERCNDLMSDRPDIHKIRHRGWSKDSWRAGDFSIKNRVQEELRVKEIRIGFPSSEIRIAPAITEEASLAPGLRTKSLIRAALESAIQRTSSAVRFENSRDCDRLKGK